MDLDAFSDSLTTTPPAAAPVTKSPRRTPRAPDAPPSTEGSPVLASAPAARSEPGASLSSAAAPSLDEALDAVLVGGEAGLTARFDRLVTEQADQAADALAQARLDARGHTLEADRASAEVAAAERRLLAERTDEARRALDAARERAATARQVADLAARDVTALEAAHATARQTLAEQLFQRAIGRAHPDATMASLAPELERLWQAYLALAGAVDAIETKLARAYERTSLLTSVARLAGIELSAASPTLGALHRQWPGLAHVFAIGMGTRALDTTHVLTRWSEQLTRRARESGGVRHLSYWLTPG